MPKIILKEISLDNQFLNYVNEKVFRIKSFYL